MGEEARRKRKVAMNGSSVFEDVGTALSSKAN
jgi:hypothetical protein